MRRLAGREDLDFLGIVLVVLMLLGFFLLTDLQPLGNSDFERPQLDRSREESWLDRLLIDKQTNP